MEGDVIMILKRKWLDLILAGVKTLEVRCMRHRDRVYFLGCEGKVHGRMRVKGAELVADEARWAALRPQHCVPGRRPYARTWALSIVEVKRLAAPVEYQRQLGQIGTANFRPVTPLAAPAPKRKCKGL